MYNRKYRILEVLFFSHIQKEVITVTDKNNFTTAVSERKTYSVSEIVAILGIGKNKAYELCNSKKFKTVRIGKSIRIVKESFDLWFNGGNQL